MRRGLPYASILNCDWACISSCPHAVAPAVYHVTSGIGIMAFAVDWDNVPGETLLMLKFCMGLMEKQMSP